jgi:cytoskeleton protein RodZ
MDIGSTLRSAREQQGRSLDQLAATTKISTATLRAIETNQIQHLPGGIFLRGFLRAYAREVRLDPETIVAEYVAQFEPQPTRVGAGAAADPAGKDLPVDAAAPTVAELVSRDVSIRSVLLTGGLALGLLAYMTLRVGSPTVPAADRSVPTPAVVAASNPETGTAGQRDAAAASSIGSSEAPRVEIHATGPCWISVTVDGQRVFQKLMQSGDIETLDISHGADVRIGDPATFSFFINGEAGRPLGVRGVPTTVHVDRDNYKNFLSRGE